MYREPHPIRAAAVLSGLGAGALWMLLFGLLAGSVRSYAWLSLVAGGIAWLVSMVLALFGDRGVAVGVAISAGAGLAIATLVVVAMWGATGWPLW
jgi:hypothetical protein